MRGHQDASVWRTSRVFLMCLPHDTARMHTFSSLSEAQAAGFVAAVRNRVCHEYCGCSLVVIDSELFGCAF